MSAVEVVCEVLVQEARELCEDQGVDLVVAIGSQCGCSHAVGFSTDYPDIEEHGRDELLITAAVCLLAHAYNRPPEIVRNLVNIMSGTP